MVGLKACVFFSLLVALVASKNNFRQRGYDERNFDERESAYQELTDLARRLYQDEVQEARRTAEADREIDESLFDMEEDENEKRGINDTDDYVLTVQNAAVMNVRLKVLYTNKNGEPFENSTGTLIVGKTGTIRLPPDTQFIKFRVQKDLIGNTWRDVISGRMAAKTFCIRVTGVTLITKITPCKK